MPLDTAGANNVTNDAIINWMRQYSLQKRRCEEENGVLRNIVKRAKADGVNVKATIQTVVVSKLDIDDVKRDLRDQLRYMALRRMPISAAELFDGWDDAVSQKTQAEDDTWAAEDAGYYSGRHNGSLDDSPFPPGSELDVRWRAQWHKGQAAIAREMGPDAKPASSTRQRPARRTAAPEAAPEAPRSDTTTSPRPRRSASRASAGGRKGRAGAEPHPDNVVAMP